MPLTRWIISANDFVSSPATDVIVNTLYFNVSGSVDDPDYNSLGNDLWTIWAARPWVQGRFLDIRGYNMDDPEPRPQRYLKRQQVTGSSPEGPHQISLALSYYADRNLPRQRGRIYIGPWSSPGLNATVTQTTAVMALPPLLAGLGGLNVDWSLWSPTTQTHTRINHAWVDNSWDVVRSRKLKSTVPRVTWNGDG